MEKIRQIITNHLWWFILLVAVGLLTAHSFGIRTVTVDNTSLILVAIILASPFVALIKKIKIGEFEAEIQSEEVKRITRQVDKVLPEQTQGKISPPEISGIAASILDLVEADPVLALAKLRIEIETRLRRLASSKTNLKSQKPLSLTHLVRELVASEIISQALSGPLLDVISICNRAVHGEDINEADAQRIAETGVDLIEVLEHTLPYSITHPVSSMIISPKELDELQGELQAARFRVTTVVPLVTDPERKVYELTQSEFNEFLDGYPEHAEFIVNVERIS